MVMVSWGVSRFDGGLGLDGGKGYSRWNGEEGGLSAALVIICDM